ncbi:hypothetical protein [Nocardia vulneris]|uniref:Uncharacterized protein n=1 Tax=Nocardia vulneris TaxID=1141657 RepID=A0ABR4ZD62_9NOCA|nr:hypothetical protein [Nocardia vulneris]KIA63032.1 hypothetical protein FG87_21965 [Nocardia vulneris]
MISDDDRATAALVLAKCAANDPWFPHGGESTVLAWAEVFGESGLSREDLLSGVARAYRMAEEGFRPLPASIVRHARAAYFEQLKALTDEQRELMEEANYVLQDMGISPPEAHRFARRVALGREPQLQLTEQQATEFRRRLQERQQLPKVRRAVEMPGFARPLNEVIGDA